MLHRQPDVGVTAWVQFPSIIARVAAVSSRMGDSAPVSRRPQLSRARSGTLRGKDLEAALRVDLYDVDVHYNLGVLRFRRGDDAADVEESLQTALCFDPRHAIAFHNSGEPRFQCGDATLSIVNCIQYSQTL